MKKRNFSNEPHFRYLPVLPSQKKWGLSLTDCGYTVIEPGTAYPPPRHPDAYQFDWKTGRKLDEYQVVYITAGSGVFEAQGVRRQIVEAGDIFFLFPGVWHRYTPDPKTGWTEHWLGFTGDLAKRFLSPPFVSPAKPVLQIGVDERLRQCFVGLVDEIIRNPAGTPFSSAGELIKILGIVQELVQGVGVNRELSMVIREAQNRILRQAASPISFEKMASELGVGYTSFRHRFKQQTGMSPSQFQSSIRINRSKDLLASTDLSISEVAVACGFETVYYFSRSFSQKTGLTPSAFRANSKR